MATLAKIEMSGMTIKAEPKFETISLKEVSSPVSVLFRLKAGTMKSGSPSSMFPVKMKLKFRTELPSYEIVGHRRLICLILKLLMLSVSGYLPPKID